MPTSQPGNPLVCSGRTPGYWKQDHHFNAWPVALGYRPVAMPGPAPAGGPATMFGDVFQPPQPYTSMTLLDVLKQGGGPPHNVGRHIVAALLNALTGKSTVLSIAAIRGIWYQFATTGFYQPSAGVQWDHNKITAYLESTMPV